MLGRKLTLILENVYYFTGSLLFICSCWQLLIAKKAQNNLCTRQTAELIKDFNETVVKYGKQFLQVLILENLNNTVNGSEPITNDLKYRYSIFINKYSIEIYSLLNFLEIYSTQINKRMVNEYVAFECNGLTYCEYVRNFCVIIRVLRINNNKLLYKNTMDLYNYWKEKLENR